MRKTIFLASIVISIAIASDVHATDVGGIISSNTTWTLANSPYFVTDLIQVAEDVTLTIEAGVIVNRSGGTHIQVFGGFNAIGTETSKIIFNDIRIYGSGDNLTLPLHVEYAEFNDGGFATGYSAKPIILKNSILRNNTGQTLMYSPISESHIERNIFDHWGGISVQIYNSGKVYIRNNVFYEVTYNNGSAIQIGTNSSTNPVISYNSFLSYEPDHPAMSCLNGPDDVNAINNYWNTTDTSIIDLMIRDRNDNLNIDNYIIYLPILTEPDANTPIFFPDQLLTVQTEPNDVNTVTPSVGEHICSGLVDISAQPFIDCPDVYQFDYWDGDVTDANSASTTVFMDSDKTIKGVFVATRECGDECHPNNLFGDYNHDCIIDFNDFAKFADNWLVCTKPECD